MLDIILTLLIGAVIGYITNWLAIKMLFSPLREKRLFGLRMPFTPGLIPKERFVLSNKIGQTTASYVLTDDALTDSLKSNAIDIEAIVENGLSRLSGTDLTIGGALEKMGLCGSDFDRAALDEYLLSFIEEQLYGEKLLAWLSGLTLEREKLAEAINGIVARNIGNIGGLIGSLLEKNPDFENSLRELVRKIAEENFGKLIGIFINYNRIYDNIKRNILEYLADGGQQRLMTDRLTERINDLINKDFNDNIQKLFNNSESNLRESIIRLLRDKLPYYRQKLLDTRINGVSRLFADYPGAKRIIVAVLESAVENGGGFLLKNIDFGKLIEDKINSFDVAEAEEIILSVVKKELSAITWIGALLGFIIALVPVLARLI